MRRAVSSGVSWDETRPPDDSGADEKEQLAVEHAQQLASRKEQTERNIRSLHHYQVVWAMTGLLLMIVQHEIAWSYNTEVGHGHACATSLNIPGCVENWTGSGACCDPRLQARFFPVRYGRIGLNVVRAFITLTTLLLLNSTWSLYKEKLNAQAVLHGLLKTPVSPFSSRYRYRALFELTVFVIHVFPDADNLTSTPSLYLFLCVAMFIRLPYCFRLYRWHSHLNSRNAHFISSLTHVKFTTGFVVKQLMREHTFLVLGAFTVAFLLVFGYCLYMIESVMCGFDYTLNCAPLTFWGAQWVVVMTILTVGYGDVIPFSDGGRFIAVCCGVYGMILAAFCIWLVGWSTTSLSRSESKVLAFIRKHEHKMMLENAAVRLVQASFRFRSAESKYLKELAAGVVLGVGSSPSKIPRGIDMDNLRRPEHYPKKLRLLLQAVFDRGVAFKSIRKWVATQDPSSSEERHMNLMEAVSVNIEQMKDSLAAFIASEVEKELRQSPGRDIDPAVEANLTPIVRKRLQSMTNSSSVASLPVVTMSATTPIAASSKPSLPPLHRASSNRSPSPEPPALVSARPAASPPPWMQTLQSAIENVANTLQEMNSRLSALEGRVAAHEDKCGKDVRDLRCDTALLKEALAKQEMLLRDVLQPVDGSSQSLSEVGLDADRPLAFQRLTVATSLSALSPTAKSSPPPPDPKSSSSASLLKPRPPNSPPPVDAIHLTPSGVVGEHKVEDFVLSTPMAQFSGENRSGSIQGFAVGSDKWSARKQSLGFAKASLGLPVNTQHLPVTQPKPVDQPRPVPAPVPSLARLRRPSDRPSEPTPAKEGAISPLDDERGSKGVPPSDRLSTFHAPDTTEGQLLLQGNAADRSHPESVSDDTPRSLVERQSSKRALLGSNPRRLTGRPMELNGSDSD